MKKDIEWLKKEIEEYLEYEGVHDARIALESVLGYIDQLDGPETLSWQWIYENKVARINNVRKMTASDVVTVEKLKNLLVPKQEITFEQAHDKLREESILSEKSFDYYWNCINDNVEIDEPGNLLVPKQDKPVIPQFVADYIELNKGWNEDRQEYIEDDNSGLWFALDGNSYGMPNSVSDWLFNEEKVETFAKAWLDGYEVEKEPQWAVRYEDGYFSEEIKFGCGIDGDWVDEVSRAYHFTDKAKAEAVALLVGGTVEEVTE